MRVQVLYIADCPHHQPAVKQVREALRVIGVPEKIEEVEIRTMADAEAWRFPGSPTVRVNGLDVEPEARKIQHFGVGCRSYVENGYRSGLPSKTLVLRVLQENAGGPTTATGDQKRNGPEAKVLVAGGVAALLASTCCLGPLILVAAGVSGAWIGNLSRLEPFRPWFIGAALIALLFAARRILRPAGTCVTGEICTLPATRRTYKVLFGMVAVLVAVALAYPLLARFFY